MDILNLSYPEKSDIKFKEYRFPDGQNQIVIESLKSKVVTIYSRLNTFIHLEKIICATKSLKELGVKEIHLYIPYFLGSRSDRKFEEGSNNYLKDVICPIINSLKFNSVTVLDPHSDVLEACLDNFKKIDNTLLVDDTISTLYGDENVKWDEFILISPDAGANKKIFKVAEQIGYTGDIITCSKSRDENGRLSRVEIPFSDEAINNQKDFIIIDDICDGGATFINIAKKIQSYKNKRNTGKIYLIVTHGIFSKGFKELNKYFDGIYCTNSYKDICDIEYDEKTNVKQLNVF